MSSPHHDLYQSPVTVTENRFYLNGEPWVLAREADLPIFVERQAESPKPPKLVLNHTPSLPFPGLHRRDLFPSSSQREGSLKKMDLDWPRAGHENRQRIQEPESPCPLHRRLLNASEEIENCVAAGSCKRLHLLDRHLCKKIVQKARRAISKLGRKPESKPCRSSTIPLAIHQDSITFTDSAHGTGFGAGGSFDTLLPELSGGGTAHELPAEEAGACVPALYEAPDGSVLRQESQNADFGYFSDVMSSQTQFQRYYGSDSSISTWSQKPWQSSTSSQYTWNTNLSDLKSPTRKLSELEGSFSSSSTFSSWAPTTNPSRILPGIGENGPTNIGPITAGTFDWPKGGLDTRVTTESVSWQKQPVEGSVMGDWNLCASPTSLLATDYFSDQPIEASEEHELDSANYKTQKSTAHEAAAIVCPSKDIAKVEYPSKWNSTLSNSSVGGLHLSGDCHITMPLCPCHELPMRPDMDMSVLMAGAKSCGVSSHLLVQDDHCTLRSRIESMFNLLLELALQKLEAFEHKVRNVLAPTFKTLPTFQSSLKALDHLYVTQSVTHIHELVSLVFMAFSIAILTIDERDLSQYTGMLYIDIASWTDALSSISDKHAFDTFLKILWLPQVPYPTASFQQRHYCPFTIPRGLSIQDWKSSPLSNHVGLRTSMALRLCLSYVDLIHHAAENEVASGFYSADHGLDKYQPPLFLDSAMTDLIQPSLELEVSETMKEVVSSTAQGLHNGELSSFNEVDAHLRSGVLKQPGHFGSDSSRTSHLFSAMCHNAMIMFAGRKLAWLAKVLQSSANRVVSQTWAEGVHAPMVDMQEQHEGATLNPEAFVTDTQCRIPYGLKRPNDSIVRTRSQPDLSSPYTARRYSRHRKVSQDTTPSRCHKCGRIFEGKWRRDHLRRHLRSVHGNHYRTCPGCGATLKDRTDNFTKHLQKCNRQYGK